MVREGWGCGEGAWWWGVGGGGIVRVVDKGGLKEARRAVADKKALERKKKGVRLGADLATTTALWQLF